MMHASDFISLLNAREERVIKIQQLINSYNKTVVVYKLNLPGPIKYGGKFDWAFKHGLQLFCRATSDVMFTEITLSSAGYTAYFVLNLEPKTVKRITIEIEERDIGRLLDFDVYHQGGTIGRSELGLSARKCLICNQTVWLCSRSRRHNIVTLMTKVEELINNAMLIEEEKYGKS